MLRGLGKLTLGTLRLMDRRVDTPLDHRPRGVALVITLIALVIMSTTVVHFVYASRVNTAMVINERDNLKSYYLAKSGMNLTRMLLGFQYALQEASRDTDDEMGVMIGRAMRRSNFQIYQYVDLLMGPFNSGAVEIPLARVDLKDMGVGGFGEFAGRFEVEAQPEEGRINLNRFARDEIAESDLVEFCSMIIDSRYDPLFEQRDHYGDLIDRARMTANIIDFIDLNEEATIIGDACNIEGRAGDEMRPYLSDDQYDIEPRNARLTHVEELYRVHGINEPFMNTFADAFTVYDVGRPNLNVARAPVFYSVLCRNLEFAETEAPAGDNFCSADPEISDQVMYLAMTLEGIRYFFDDPLAVMLAYVGSTQANLLPSAKVGQPTAFLSVSQLASYIEDLMDEEQGPYLIAQFLPHSPTYREMVAENPAMAIDPINPRVPVWRVEFNRSGLMRSVTTRTPRVFRIRSTGAYGTSNTTIEAVVDYDKTIRRLPPEDQMLADLGIQLEELEADADALDEQERAEIEEMRGYLEQERADYPRGRIMYWRVE